MCSVKCFHCWKTNHFIVLPPNIIIENWFLPPIEIDPVSVEKITLLELIPYLMTWQGSCFNWQYLLKVQTSEKLLFFNRQQIVRFFSSMLLSLLECAEQRLVLIELSLMLLILMMFNKGCLFLIIYMVHLEDVIQNWFLWLSLYVLPCDCWHHGHDSGVHWCHDIGICVHL